MDQVTQRQGHHRQTDRRATSFTTRPMRPSTSSTPSLTTQAGKGTAGKLLKDPALYNNANETIANVEAADRRHQRRQGRPRQAGQRRGVRRQAAEHHEQAVGHHRSAGRAGHGGQALQGSLALQQCRPDAVETRELIKAIRENPKKYLPSSLKEVSTHRPGIGKPARATARAGARLLPPARAHGNWSAPSGLTPRGGSRSAGLPLSG